MRVIAQPVITQAQLDEKVDKAPADGNYRIDGGNALQIRETSDNGFRTPYYTSGVLKKSASVDPGSP